MQPSLNACFHLRLATTPKPQKDLIMNFCWSVVDDCMMNKTFGKVFQTSVLPANSTPTYKLLRVSEVAFIAGHNLIRSHVICKPDKTPNDKFRKQASQHDRQASSGAVCEKYIIQCLNQLHSQPQCCLRDFDLASSNYF